MNPYSFQLGAFSCLVLSDNTRSAPLAGLFSSVSQNELETALNGAADIEVAVGYNVLLIDTGHERVLVDAGVGQGNLLADLQKAGLKPDDIDCLILTHGDGDHIGGLDQFTEAQQVMTETMWRRWTRDSDEMVEEFIKLFRAELSADALAARSKGRAAFGEKLSSLDSRVRRVESGAEVVPGIRLFSAPGHRSDHSTLEITSAGETLLHVVDSLRHPVQLQHPDWASFIDSYPAQLATTNRRLIARALETNAQVFATHLPFPGLGRIVQGDVGLKWERIES